jgi:hypothetical protein
MTPASFVGRGDETEEQLSAVVVEGCEADLVDEDESALRTSSNHPTDRVVGESAGQAPALGHMPFR